MHGYSVKRFLLTIYTNINSQVILSSNVYIDKSPEYRLFEPWLGNGLLISTGKLRDDNNIVFVIKYHVIGNL